jgi:CRISPR-associated endonuclease Cas2
MFMVISYDISEDKRRTKIHKMLKSYGQWMQYSVFECDVTDSQYAKLRARLSKMIVFGSIFSALVVTPRWNASVVRMCGMRQFFSLEARVGRC